MQDWHTPEYQAAQRRSYERIRDKHPSLVTRGFECYTGWHPILERYFDEVARLKAAHPGAIFFLKQVKEKMGGLRIYALATDDIRDGGRAAYGRAIEEAERTCEVCGRAGVLRVRTGAYMTRCEDHADGGEPFVAKES
jgi:hypothetical protein